MERFCEMDALELVSKPPVFRDIEPEAKQEIAANAVRIANFRESRSLYEAGDPSDARCFVLLGGIAEMTHPDRGALWHFGPGSLLGAENLTAGVPHRYSMIARSSCHLLVLNGWFTELIRKYPLLEKSVSAYVQMLRSAQESHYVQLLRMGKPARVALTLLNIARAVEPQILEDDAARFPFPVRWWTTQDMVSDLLRISRPKVREALEIVSNSGAISVGMEGNSQIEMPPVLLRNSTSALDRVIATRL